MPELGRFRKKSPRAQCGLKTQLVEHTRAVGRQLNTRTNLRKPGSLFEYMHMMATSGKA
jgi:hypothetical protein